MPRPHRTLPAHLPRRVALVGAAATLVLAGCTQTPSTAPTTAPLTTSSTAPPTSPPTSTTRASTTVARATTTTPPAPATRAALSAPTDVATGLEVPWSAIALPDGGVLVSERDTGRIRRVTVGGPTTTVGTVPGVEPSGEGGLLGLAIDRRTFSTNRVLYAYYSTGSDNRVVRMPLDAGGRLGAPTAILTGIPRSSNHNGGRLAFGPDGYLYVTTGDANTRPNAQSRQSLGGKILRITGDGRPAPGNPFAGSPVWTYGHRNVQGIAWDATGRMWASEFGQNTWDELNVITAGGNYGWPTIEGAEGRSGFIDPVRQWRTDDASPSGIAIGPDGSVFLAALKGESLWKVPVTADGGTGEPQRLLRGTYGRIRDVLIGPDGNLWIVTNNTARGNPRAGDDRIVRLPQSLTG